MRKYKSQRQVRLGLCPLDDALMSFGPRDEGGVICLGIGNKMKKGFFRPPEDLALVIKLHGIGTAGEVHLPDREKPGMSCRIYGSLKYVGILIPIFIVG